MKERENEQRVKGSQHLFICTGLGDTNIKRSTMIKSHGDETKEDSNIMSREHDFGEGKKPSPNSDLHALKDVLTVVD